MKLILSRKGFDSKAGGHPSPIYSKDKVMLSLPIPSKCGHAWHRVKCFKNGQPLIELIGNLGIGAQRDKCHLDPDLNYNSLDRESGWKGSLGQAKAAQGHLKRQDISIGDIFLFFGWFSDQDQKQYRDVHALFGYLQIGEIYNKKSLESGVPDWLKDHPHMSKPLYSEPTNTIYVARDKLSFDTNYPGYGIFNFSPDLVLTKEGLSRSKWNLPKKIFGNKKISYHSQKSWKEEYFQSAYRGQEFVIDCDEQILKWIKTKIRVGME